MFKACQPCISQMSERSRGIGFGGIGALHTLVTRLGLDEAINQEVPLLKAHCSVFRVRPCAQHRHSVLTGEELAWKTLIGCGTTGSYAEGFVGRAGYRTRHGRGDFLRAFQPADMRHCRRSFNQARAPMSGRGNRRVFSAKGIIDVDGTMPKRPENQAGDGHPYKESGAMRRAGVAGQYQRALYLVNRPGNQTSSAEPPSGST